MVDLLEGPIPMQQTEQVIGFLEEAPLEFLADN
jgi:hypothetical protein